MRDCFKLLQNFGSWTSSYTPREANNAAHLLAKHSGKEDWDANLWFMDSAWLFLNSSNEILFVLKKEEEMEQFPLNSLPIFVFDMLLTPA